MSCFKDLTGKTFNRLTVLRLGDRGKRNDIRWLCQCTCGNKVNVLSYSLKSGKTKSCGCLSLDKLLKRATTHGKSWSGEYRSWFNMKARCNNKKNPAYVNYGGRGITVCARWSAPNGFKYFYEDMGKRPSSKHTIDRINNDGNYCPENCRWATRLQQNRNQRKRKDNASGIPGVSISSGKWQASIGVNKKKIYLGKFTDINDAIRARKEAEKRYW